VAGPTILVFGDSLSFHGPADPMPSDEPRLWPNVAASALGGSALLFAGVGWTARDAWWALVGDPNVWASLPKIDVVVLAVGGMDSLPSPLPTYLRVGLRYLRPDRLRRLARRAYTSAQPALSRLLRGRPVALPPRQTARYLDEVLGALRALRPDLPVVGVLPPTHRSAAYGFAHEGRRATADAVAAWGRRRGVPLVDLYALTRDHVLGGRGNPDGMHWGWEAHAEVGAAVAAAVLAVLAPGDDPAARRPAGDRFAEPGT
jgi:diglucosylglycerate octanoyltransferase